MIPAKQIVNNVKGLLRPNETIYIATDDASKIKDSHQVYFPLTPLPKLVEHPWFKSMYDQWGGKEKVKFYSDFYKPLRLQEVKNIWIGTLFVYKTKVVSY